MARGIEQRRDSYTTIIRRPPDQGDDYNVCIVELEEGVRMMSRVEGVAPSDVRIGMAVTAYAGKIDGTVTRSFAMRVPPDTERLVVDTPAALEPQRLPDLTRNATAVLVPVLPSDIDIHAAAKCISDLLLIANIRRDEHRIAVIANRVKKNTVVYKSLMKFLETLHIPVVTTLRDSQTYIRAAESGSGVFEMKAHLVREDVEQWLPLIGWLSQRRPLHIEPGTPAITSAFSSPRLSESVEGHAAVASREAVRTASDLLAPRAAPAGPADGEPPSSERDDASPVDVPAKSRTGSGAGR